MSASQLARSESVSNNRFGVYSIDLSVNAGLDLEMPGTNKWRTLDLMNRSIQSRKLTPRTIKQRAKKVLELVKKCANGAPEVRAAVSGVTSTHCACRFSMGTAWNAPLRRMKIGPSCGGLLQNLLSF